MLNDKTFDRESKINELCRILDRRYPELEGDKVTFIGSTFMRYGEKEPYFNHCIALDTCDHLPDVENSQIDCYKTEREVLCLEGFNSEDRSRYYYWIQYIWF